MGSVGNPNPWGAYGNYKDCSQGICSIYCPQWCYIIFPPPPPSDNSGTDFSPLIIAVMGILASTFLLICYYTIISKYCRRRGDDDNNISAGLDENGDEMNHQAVQIVPAGLDDAIIKSITVSKYKKGDGLVEGRDCSVCLSEFQEDESLRLLPKCNHAFHLPCIDTWLKSHSTCPLCRSIINITNPLAPDPIPEARSSTNINISALEYRHRTNDSVLMVHELESGTVVHEDAIVSLNVPHRVIIKEENYINNVFEGVQQLRRSFSFDSCSRHGRVSIADILSIKEDDDGFQEYGKTITPAPMVRCSSTGRFTNSIIPN